MPLTGVLGAHRPPALTATHSRLRHHGRQGAEAARRFAECREAFEVLSDAGKRALYDAMGTKGVREWEKTEGQRDQWGRQAESTLRQGTPGRVRLRRARKRPSMASIRRWARWAYPAVPLRFPRHALNRNPAASSQQPEKKPSQRLFFISCGFSV